MDFGKIDQPIDLSIKLAIAPDLPREFHSFDIESPTGYEPPDPMNVCFALQLDIGQTLDDGSDIFSCLIVTENRAAKSKDRHGLIKLHRYSHEVLCERLHQIVKSCERPTWYDCLLELRKYFAWEYDGMYTEDGLKQLNGGWGLD